MDAMKKWWIGAPLAWAGVVTVVALLAWWVIDGAGESVLADPARDVVTPTTTGSDPPSRSGSSREDPSSTTTPPPSTPPPPAPPPTAGSSGSSTSAATTDQSAPVRRTSTWQGEEGLLRVSCLGQDLQLDGATPAGGYEIDKNERRSGSELEVRFRSADGDRRVEIEVACVGGVPAFSVERD